MELEIEAFLNAYLECALWADAAELDTEDYTIEDFAPEALEAAHEDCTAFITENAEDLRGLDAEHAGHDFWLTRNGHGAGYWDRPGRARGQRLTDSAQAYPEVNLYAQGGYVWIS